MSSAEDFPNTMGDHADGDGTDQATSPVPEFTVDVVPDRARVLVRPVGDVDIATAEQLERPVVELMERGFSHVVVDLRGVTFLDSTGVHALVQCRERAEERGARMSIIPGGMATRRVLDITGLIDHFEIEPSPDGHRPARAG
jgi:anti-sigma B factor antagonist